MDLIKNGKLLRDLRASKSMTQKQVADILGVQPKTVSKWETGKGFPDVSVISKLADIFGVSEKILLEGSLVKNRPEPGNLKRIRFYVCPCCGSTLYGTGESKVICCGKFLEPLKPQKSDKEHLSAVSHIENDFYIEFNCEMTKEHYIGFVAYVRMDRVLFIRLYPEQEPAVRFPAMYGGTLYYYCTKHGLFECKGKDLK